jgi:hypothetical protein
MGAVVDRTIYKKVARFLLDGEDQAAVNLLLECSVQIDWQRVAVLEIYTVEIGAGRRAYDILTQPNHPITQDIRRAFTAFLAPNTVNFTILPEVAELQDDWKIEVRQEIGRVEIRARIAAALDKAGALYVQNGATHFGLAGEREQSVIDFLVFKDHQWAVLMVGDAPTVDDALAAKGVVLSRFSTQRCAADPEGVVREFLN